MKTKQSIWDDTTKRVVEMYSQYPYPFVGTHGDMFKNLVYPLLCEQGKVNSILEAGCGTGNVAIAIAQLLPDVKVIGIDITEESIKIAEESARMLGLKNLEFRYSNLVEYDEDLGTFDFIHCQGVIHHLSDPSKGLENLYKYLNPGRHAYIWVYMLLGRRFILEIRELQNLLQATDEPYEDKIEFLKRILPVYFTLKKGEGLKRYFPSPPSKKPNNSHIPLYWNIQNVLKNSAHSIIGFARKMISKPKSVKNVNSSNQESINTELEDKRYKIGLSDMYLHPHDVFFRMSEIIHLFNNAGFSEVRIIDGMPTNIEQVFGENFSDIKQLVSKLPIEKQWEFLEILEKPSGIGFFIKKP